MSNKFASVLTALVVFCSACVTAVATPMTTAQAAQALLASSDRVVEDDNGDGILYCIRQDEVKSATTMINQCINNVFRSCDYRALPDRTYYVDQKTYTLKYILKNDVLDTLAAHQDAVDKWAHFVTTQLFPNGTDRNTVLKLCHLHITRNYGYDREIFANADRDKQLLAQDAYYMVTTGKAICASYAHAFRALVEEVPFDPVTGLVNWSCINPVHMKCAIITDCSIRHAWNAIQDPDGTWFYYDLTYEDPESLDTFHMSESMIHKYPSNWGTAQTNEWNY